jgi:carbamate kinase
VVLAPEPKRVFEQVVTKRRAKERVAVEFTSGGGAPNEFFEGQCHVAISVARHR